MRKLFVILFCACCIWTNESVSAGSYYHAREHYTPDGRDTVFAHPFMSHASFPGGENILQAFLRTKLVHKGVFGSVFVRFSVTKEGDLKNIRIIKSLNSASDAEAIRVIKSMPQWTPAVYNGKPVDRYYSLPILFAPHPISKP